MTIHKMTDAEILAIKADWQQQVAETEPRFLNVEAATTTHDDGVLYFRSRVFHVPPVPAAVGLRIFVLERHLHRLFRQLHAFVTDQSRPFTDPEVREVGLEIPATYEALAAEYWACVRPVTLYDRLTWRWRANPFLSASESEVRALADFFFGARTRSHVRWVSSIRAPQYLRSTWPATSPPSRPAIRRGAAMASPAAGSTTASAREN